MLKYVASMTKIETNRIYSLFVKPDSGGSREQGIHPRKGKKPMPRSSEIGKGISYFSVAMIKCHTKATYRGKSLFGVMVSER